MTAPTYLPSDMRSVNVSRAHGGCGQSHIVSSEHSISCDLCAPHLARFFGASGNKDNVAKTVDEVRNEAKLTREGELRAKEIAAAFASVIAEQAARNSVDVPVVDVPKAEKPPARPRKTTAKKVAPVVTEESSDGANTRVDL